MGTEISFGQTEISSAFSNARRTPWFRLQAVETTADRPTVVMAKCTEELQQETLLETRGGGRERRNQTTSARCLRETFSLAPSDSHTPSAECRGTLHVYFHGSQNDQLQLASLHKSFASLFSNISKTTSRRLCELVRRRLK